MALDSLLIELLVCPQDKGPLWYLEDEATLYNPRLRRRYPIRDEIPVLLIEEADSVDDAEHERLMAAIKVSGVRTGGGEGDPDAEEPAVKEPPPR